MRSFNKYKRFLAWSMLLIYFLGIFKIVQPYIVYKLNYKYISTVLCENKEKPQMHCDGKCHLKKELKKAAREEKSHSNSMNGKSFENENIAVVEIIVSPAFFESLTKIKYPFISKNIIVFSSDNPSPPPKV